jgi:predicted ArsR family transcriptional regulator
VTPATAVLLEVECPDTYRIWELAAAQPQPCIRINANRLSIAAGFAGGSAVYRHLDRLVELGAIETVPVCDGADQRGFPCQMYRLTQPFPGRTTQ